MNAIQSNAFTQTLVSLGKKLPKPTSILCVSAHWQTRGEWVTHMQVPPTIHDFYGFPRELTEVQYPAPGNPALAERIRSALQHVRLDESEWGLDHGTWSVLKWIYPEANIPVVQLSIDLSKPFSFHVELGEKLKFLRDEGVLIVGSGNIVHNLGTMTWKEPAKIYDWAGKFDAWIEQRLMDRDIKALAYGAMELEEGQKSIPTPDHYIPFLYTVGASDDSDNLRFIYKGIEYGSISMRSMIFEP